MKGIRFLLPAFVCSAVLLLPTGMSLAGTKVTLPATAKMLTKAEIITVYGGKSTEWAHPNTDKATGTVTFDAGVTQASGTWKAGKDSGKWEGKITFKGDQYCYETRGSSGDKPFPKKYNKMVCNLVFQDVDGMVYEVDPKNKKVISTDRIVN